MAHRVFWRVPQQILCMELEGIISLDDFIQINQTIVDHLGDEIPDRDVALLVDITQPGHPPRSYPQLKASQTYVMRRDLKFILVVGNDKFMRLMTLLTFNLCRPSLMFFDDMDQALRFVQRNFRVFK